MPNIINPDQNPDYQLFKYSGDLSDKLAPEVRINVEDLVRTGFKDKYNELAQSVIYNIYSRFSAGTSGQQSLVFETSKGEFEIAIVGAGVVQGVGIITADSVIYNATVGSQTLTNVQEALDLLLYTPPTIGAISGGWSGSYFEVGVNPITSNATVNGNRQVKNLASVKLQISRTTAPVASGPSAIQVPAPANQTPVTATLLATAAQPFVTTSTTGTYVLTGTVLDTQTPTPNNGASITSSKTMQLVFPIIFGSSAYDTFTNSNGNVQTQFNSVFMPSSTTTLPGTYNTNGISLPIYRNIIPKPTSINVIHANGLFTYFLFPQAYYANIAALLSTFRIQDGSTNLNYPYDTGTSFGIGTPSSPAPSGSYQDASAEWRVRSITLNNGSLWSGIPYYLVTSKVAKPKLTLKYTF